MTLLKLFPLIIERKHHVNASNNRWRIVINTDVNPKGAILCQERFEWGYKWRRLFRSVDRVEMELIGHEIEVQVACRDWVYVSEKNYRWIEAYSMATRYPQFADWDATRIDAAMRLRTALASAWIDRHRGFVDWAVGVG